MDYVNELMNNSYTFIQKAGVLMQQAQDDELKMLIEQHLRHTLEAYNTKVCFQEGETVQFVMREQSISTFSSLQLLQEEGDEDIALHYLTCIKQLAYSYAQAAIEVANPELRRFMENGFIITNRHAYEIWKYMIKHNLSLGTNLEYKQA